jgi:hypothetical protein
LPEFFVKAVKLVSDRAAFLLLCFLANRRRGFLPRVRR